MPRIARGHTDGLIFHILNHGNGRQQVFHKDGDFKAFVELMATAHETYGVSILAYCLMSNHFHLLLQPPKAEDLFKSMQWLMTSHVRRYHRHYGTSGHVWQGRYKSFIVQEDDQLLTVFDISKAIQCGRRWR
jgi:REP-associated tyrosine transposase